MRDRPLPNALTVDLEEWFHVFDVPRYADPSAWDAFAPRVEECAREALALFARRGARATFFTLGWIARRYPDLVRRIRDEGHELASHGYLHVRAFDSDEAGLRRDIEASLEALEDVAGVRPAGYRAPEWSLIRETEWMWPLLASLGFRYSSSTVPLTGMGQRGYPPLPFRVETWAGPILEFPVSTMRAFWEGLPYSGGLPLRCAPYWYIVEKLRYENSLGHPGMVYLHPWELDRAHPPMELSLGRRFMHFFRMSSARKKIEGLLDHFAFAPMAEVLERPEVARLAAATTREARSAGGRRAHEAPRPVTLLASRRPRGEEARDTMPKGTP